MRKQSEEVTQTLSAVTSLIDGDEVGLFMKCVDCGKLLLLPIDSVWECPCCGSKNIKYVDEDMPNRDADDLKFFGHTVVFATSHAAILRKALDELNSFKKRYENLKELADVFSAIDETEKRMGFQ